MIRATGNNARTLLWLLLGLLLGGSATAYERNSPGSKLPQVRQMPRQMPQMFRPQPNSNAQGIPPSIPPQYDFSRGWSPYQIQPPQGYGDPNRPRQSSAPPYLEVALSRDQAYVQQNLILTIDTVSGANLKKIEVSLPKTDAMVFRQLGATQADARTRDGTREIVNRLHYLATPLRTGAIELPRLSVSGEFTDGRRFDASSQKALTIDVQPPESGVRPWLPLEKLELNARLLNDDAIQDGKPLTLIIEQKAIGASGSQLRSPEQQLKSNDFRLYREDTQIEGTITREGELVGSRIDTFTLIPPKDRALKVPAVRIEWWNVGQKRKETTIVPSRILNSSAGFARDSSRDLQSGPFLTGSAWVFWLPVVLFAFFTGLYWTWIWARGRSFGERFRARIKEDFAPLRRRLLRVYHLLSPRRHLHVARRILADLLPRPYRLWFCVRSADEENDPTDYGQVLRFLVQRRLGVAAQVPMTRLAEIIIDLHPRARAESIRALMNELDAAVFGQAPITDFGDWKRRFKHEIRPRLLDAFFRPRRRIHQQRLPELNPG